MTTSRKVEGTKGHLPPTLVYAERLLLGRGGCCFYLSNRIIDLTDRFLLRTRNTVIPLFNSSLAFSSRSMRRDRRKIPGVSGKQRGERCAFLCERIRASHSILLNLLYTFHSRFRQHVTCISLSLRFHLAMYAIGPSGWTGIVADHTRSMKYHRSAY